MTTATEFTHLTRAQVAIVAEMAANLVAAHSERSPSSAHATLGELDALFNLSWTLHSLRNSPPPEAP